MPQELEKGFPQHPPAYSYSYSYRMSLHPTERCQTRHHLLTPQRPCMSGPLAGGETEALGGELTCSGSQAIAALVCLALDHHPGWENECYQGPRGASVPPGPVVWGPKRHLQGLPVDVRKACQHGISHGPTRAGWLTAAAETHAGLPAQEKGGAGTCMVAEFHMLAAHTNVQHHHVDQVKQPVSPRQPMGGCFANLAFILCHSIY